MLWLKLAWRNIWRNPGRTLIQLLAIAGSLALAIWLENITRGSYDKMINDGVRMGSGHLSLHHPQYPDQRLLELVFNADKGLEVTADISGVCARLPRLHASGLAKSSQDSKATILLGVDFSAEKSINPVLASSRLVAGKIPDDEDTGLAYVGSGLCQSLRLGIGNKFVVMMQDFKGEIASKLFRIGGIFKSGVQQLDNSTIFVNRKALGKALGDERLVHEIALILDDRHSLQQNLRQLQQKCSGQNRFAAFSWETTSKQLADAIKMDHSQLEIMLLIFFILVAIGTVNLLLMSVIERTREFGLLQALGLGRNGIRKLIFAESLVLGVTGCIAGLVVGTILSLYTWHYGLDLSSMFGPQEVAGMLFEPVIKSIWEWKAMLSMTMMMLLLVIAASLYPTNKALRIGPAEAMRLY
jgi:ABC-type lipoprotein release transport system permease subunit